MKKNDTYLFFKMQSIIGEVENTLKKFMKKISSKFDIELKDVQKVWDKMDRKSSSKKKGASPPRTKKCPYEYIKGKNKGLKCNATPKDSTTSYCASHKKHEGKVQKKKNILPEKKSTSRRTSSGRKVILLKQNQAHNCYWHPETHIVFRSKDDHTAYGIVRNKTIEKLTKQDIETCKQWKFAFETPKEEKKEEEEEIDMTMVTKSIGIDSSSEEESDSDSDSDYTPDESD